MMLHVPLMAEGSMMVLCLDIQNSCLTANLTPVLLLCENQTPTPARPNQDIPGAFIVLLANSGLSKPCAIGVPQSMDWEGQLMKERRCFHLMCTTTPQQCTMKLARGSHRPDPTLSKRGICADDSFLARCVVQQRPERIRIRLELQRLRYRANCQRARTSCGHLFVPRIVKPSPQTNFVCVSVQPWILHTEHTNVFFEVL
jgi:hypothetical protein